MSLRRVESVAAREASAVLSTHANFGRRAGALATFLALTLRVTGLGEGWRDSGEVLGGGITLEFKIFQGHASNADEICPVTATKTHKYKYFTLIKTFKVATVSLCS